jgi:predicted lipoprotein with Yx(FWY)xxD motif
VLAWLLGAALGPAKATLPAGWNADVLAGAAQRWFRRFRQIGDLGRLVQLATGVSIDLTRDEFDAVRRLLADQQTWVKLRKSPVEDLAIWTAGFLPPRDGRTADDSYAAALVIIRGLLEFAVAEIKPKTFQRVLRARLMRMETGQASMLDKALFDFHSDIIARLDWIERQPEEGEDVISQVAWNPSRHLLRGMAGAVLAGLHVRIHGRDWAVAGLSMAALVLLGFIVAGAGGSTSASAASLRIVKIGGVSVLANGDGFTLYWFAADTATKSACNELCTAYWPPVPGRVTAGPCTTGVPGMIRRSDGSTQATFDGHPLYTYVGDSSPGQAHGSSPGMNGGPWHEITYPAEPGRCLAVKRAAVAGSP